MTTVNWLKEHLVKVPLNLPAANRRLQFKTLVSTLPLFKGWELSIDMSSTAAQGIENQMNPWALGREN